MRIGTLILATNKRGVNVSKQLKLEVLEELVERGLIENLKRKGESLVYEFYVSANNWFLVRRELDKNFISFRQEMLITATIENKEQLSVLEDASIPAVVNSCMLIHDLHVEGNKATFFVILTGQNRSKFIALMKEHNIEFTKEEW